ncbi:MAG: twin-arginine translocase TatA/TatE family subunit [Ktedonobacteraceae bacterium]
MFGFHLPEMIILLSVAILIFGPKKLPQIASGLGKSIKEFKKHSADDTTIDEEHKAE